MLGHGYLYINGVQMPNPTKLEYSYGKVVSSYTTEEGLTYEQIKRTGILGLSLTFQVTSYWKRRIESLPATAMTIELHEQVYQNMRITSISTSLVEGSEQTPNTDGLWEINLDLEML